MFQALLQEVVESADGSVGFLVMDLDGIALETYSKPDAEHDIKIIGIELSVVLKSVRQAASMLEAGETQEVAIVADQLTTLIRMINDNYFVALSMEPGANIGKARYLLRTRVHTLAEELA